MTAAVYMTVLLQTVSFTFITNYLPLWTDSSHVGKMT